MAITLAANNTALAIGHIIFGLLILIFPRFLRLYIGLYFILVGIVLFVFA